MSFAPLIERLALERGRALEPERLGRLARFAELAETWGARTDLTAARDRTVLVELLFLDALVLADEALVETGARVVDVGAGVGAPGLALALLRDDVDVTLVEPRRKRVAFLRTAIGTFALASRVRVVEGRIDPAAPALEGAFDVAVSRATFPPVEWLAIGLRLAASVLVLTATDDPPAAPAGARQAHRVAYSVPSSTAPRGVTRYERS